MEAVCDSSLVFSYVGGPNMWVSEADHSNCICSHEMSSAIHFLVPEEQTRGPTAPPPPPPFLSQLVGCLDCFNRDPTWSTHRASYIRYRVKFQCEDVGAEVEFQFWCTSIVISRIGFYGFVTTLPIWNGGFFPIGFELTVEPPAEASLEIWTFHARQNKHGSGTQRKILFPSSRNFHWTLQQFADACLVSPLPPVVSLRQLLPGLTDSTRKKNQSDVLRMWHIDVSHVASLARLPTLNIVVGSSQILE